MSPKSCMWYRNTFSKTKQKTKKNVEFTNYLTDDICLKCRSDADNVEEWHLVPARAKGLTISKILHSVWEKR